MQNTIESIMKEKRLFPPNEKFKSKSHFKNDLEYSAVYEESIKDPEKFWSEKANDLHWFEKWDKVFEWDKEKVEFSWFKGGKINATYNCLDRHLKTRGNKTALIWQGDKDEDVRKFTYKELHKEV